MKPTRSSTLCFVLASALFTLACAEPQATITNCDAGSGIEPHCGFQNPEDLALLPDGRTVVVSQFGDMEGHRPGNLALFDVGEPRAAIVFRAKDAIASAEPWGDPTCSGPPPLAFAPHGIDLAIRNDGRLQLLVVNHGGREAVEFFEVEPAGLETKVTWRGCAEAPTDHFFNDVVHTPEGGFLVTHMMSKESQTLELLKAGVFGIDTGWVLEWTDAGGWQRLAGTDAPFPNGIELSADGRSIYLDVYLGGEVRRIERDSGTTIASAEVSQPDNIMWSSDGTRLFVASHVGGLSDSQACLELDEGSCGMPFEIVALDPQTMERKTLVAHAGEPMGAATVALQVGDDLWLGTFAGDRVARVPGAAAKTVR